MPIDLFCDCGRALNDYRERVTGQCSHCVEDDSATAPGYAPIAEQDDSEEIPEATDPVTRRLIDDALKTHGKTECPKCWHRGNFIRMALVCPKHGVFAGV